VRDENGSGRQAASTVPALGATFFERGARRKAARKSRPVAGSGGMKVLKGSDSAGRVEGQRETRRSGNLERGGSEAEGSAGSGHG
jgi:hypothetical protein